MTLTPNELNAMVNTLNKRPLPKRHEANEVNRLHGEYKQVVRNLWKMWDNADSDEIRKGIETNVQLMDSIINELLIYGLEGKPAK
tara:strand:+ start:95 stop:349 length:255 start_codon:yes stop_codon:yes gene_type:complete